MATCVSLCAVGCEGTSSFESAEGESYCGQVTLANRAGIVAGAAMRLRLHGHGTRTTGEITLQAPATPVLVDAPLLPIPEIEGDPLSVLQFGDGRDRNLVFSVAPSGGPWLLTVISLLTNGDVEVRLLRPDLPGQGAGEFGLFRLRRQQGFCF